MGRYFISYSERDTAFASRVHQALRDRPDIQPWMAGIDDPQRREPALRVIEGSEGLLLVLSAGAISKSCLFQLRGAWEYGRPRIGLRVDRDARLVPPHLDNWPIVDFTGEFAAGLRKLLGQLDLQLAGTGDGQLRVERCERAERGWRTASTPREKQHYDLARKLHCEQMLGASPTVAAPDQSQPRGPDPSWQESDRRAGKAPPPAPAPPIRFINELPQVPSDPTQFQDRKDRTEQLHEYLCGTEVRAIAVTGAAGCGKTAMVAQYLGQLRAGSRTAPLDAVLYLGASRERPISPASLLDGLSRVVGGDDPSRYEALLLSDRKVWLKLQSLLDDLAGVRACVVIDGVEGLLDQERRRLADRDLDDLVEGLLTLGHEGIKLLLLSRSWSDRTLQGVLEVSEVRALPLSFGLRSEDTKKLLQRLDDPPILGLADIQDDIFERLHKLTGGHPRAIELLYATLRNDPRASLAELLDRLSGLPPEEAVDILMREARDPLIRPDQRILQALAIYPRSVSPDAIDALLRPYAPPGQRSEPVLRELVASRLVHQDGPRYYLPAADRDVWLDRIPEGRLDQRGGQRLAFTKLALRHRAADYCFAASRKIQVHRPADLDLHFVEIQLRIDAREFITAFKRIEELQDSFLSGWGYAGMAMETRRLLVDRLGDPEREMLNLSALADIEQDSEDLYKAVGHYRRAIRLAQRLGRPLDVAGLKVNLGGALYRLNRLSEAIDEYQTALSMAEEHFSQYELANALAGLAICYAQAGEFRHAFERADEAMRIARSDDVADLEAKICLYTGSWYGQLGETLRAIELLSEGRALAAQCQPRLSNIEGMCLGAAAEVLIDQGRIRLAIRLAEKAIAIGEDIRNAQLVREASTTLALAQVCTGGTEALPPAEVALERVYNNRTPRQALLALVLQGIVALRQDDPYPAARYFGEAQAEANELWHLEPHKFDALDIEGIAQCGLSLCPEGEADALDRAIRAFQAARALTTAPGVIVRVMRLLDELETLGPSHALVGARHAAGGRTLPSNV